LVNKRTFKYYTLWGEEAAQTVRLPSYGEGVMAESSYNFYSDLKGLIHSLFALFQVYLDIWGRGVTANVICGGRVG